MRNSLWCGVNKSAVYYFSSISCATSCLVALYKYLHPQICDLELGQSCRRMRSIFHWKDMAKLSLHCRVTLACYPGLGFSSVVITHQHWDFLWVGYCWTSPAAKIAPKKSQFRFTIWFLDMFKLHTELRKKSLYVVGRLLFLPFPSRALGSAPSLGLI